MSIVGRLSPLQCPLSEVPLYTGNCVLHKEVCFPNQRFYCCTIVNMDAKVYFSLGLNFQECSDNGLGTFNNVVTVTKRDFDVYFETLELTSPDKGVWHY